jgi:hypothetical protein
MTELDELSRMAASSDDVDAWLRPWLADRCDGLGVAQVLRLLLDAARDEALYDTAALHARNVIDAGAFVRYNRGKLRARADGDAWILEHTDGRLPLRVRDDGELAGVVTDRAALLGAACDDTRPALAIGLGASNIPAARYGVALAPLVEPELDGVTFRPVETDDDDAAAVLALLGTRDVPRAGAVWLARRDDDPVATIAFTMERGHCIIVWVAGSADDAAPLVVAALSEACALHGAATASALVTKAGLARVLEAAGFNSLEDIE